MLVKCIKKDKIGITYNKIYEVQKRDKVGDIYIIDDDKEEEVYCLNWFEIINEKVKCINNENIKNKLTINKTYEVLQKKERCYFVIDDLGNETGFASKRFEKVNKNEEKVNHPNHYNKGIETIDYIESWNMNFNVGNVIKYTTRSGHKENALEDLLKAKWYIEREIERINKES